MSTKFLNNFIFFLIFAIFNSINILSNYTYQYYERKGIIEYNNEMYDFAIENFEKAIRLNKSEAFLSYKYLGFIALKNKNRNKAKEYFYQSIRINDNQADVHFHIGEIEDYYWNHTKALFHFEKCIKLKSDYLIAYLGIARIYSLNDKFSESDNFFLKAYSLKKNESTKFLNEALLNIERGNDKTAEFLLLKGHKINPADKDIYFTISNLYRHNKRFKEAILYLEKLKYYQPHNETVYIHIANIYYRGQIGNDRKKELEIAVSNVEKAIYYNPNNPRNYELLSEIYAMLGLSKKSKEAGDKAFKLSEEIKSED